MVATRFSMTQKTIENIYNAHVCMHVYMYTYVHTYVRNHTMKSPNLNTKFQKNSSNIKTSIISSDVVFESTKNLGRKITIYMLELEESVILSCGLVI